MRSEREKIHLFRPTCGEEVLTKAAQRCARTGQLSSGRMTHQAEAAVSQRMNDMPTLALNSCTAALHVACRRLFRPDEPVYCPIMTFAATYSHLPGERRHYDHGADLERVVPDGAAVLLVDLGGAGPPDPRPLKERGCRIVLDAAHAFLLDEHRDWLRGGVVDAVCYSCGPIKELSTPGLGFVVSPYLTFEDVLYASWGVEDKVPRLPVGLNLRANSLSSAVFLEQLRDLGPLRRARKLVSRRYINAGLSIRRTETAHINILDCGSTDRKRLAQVALNRANIEHGTHYPLPAWASPTRYPGAAHFQDVMLSLPSHHHLRAGDDTDRVIEAVEGAWR